jgi:3' exoribonuclease, RNase T-like
MTTTPAVCHVMLDIETLGTRVGNVVLSVAFVRFEDHASTTLNLNIHEQLDLGLVVDPETHEWWGRQRPDTWARATENPYPVITALNHFSDWLAAAAVGRSLFIWCHGACFDAPLLQDVYRAAGLPIPWHFRNVRDTRTLYDLAGIDLRDFSDGTGDALCQTRAAELALRRLASLSNATVA